MAKVNSEPYGAPVIDWSRAVFEIEEGQCHHQVGEPVRDGGCRHAAPADCQWEDLRDQQPEDRAEPDREAADIGGQAYGGKPSQRRAGAEQQSAMDLAA
jgi:hypothetical protein